MDDMTDEQTTDSFIKAIEQLEWIAKSHHDAIVRVRELHKEDNTGYCELCTAIATPDGSDYLSKYPCETIKALDGEIGSTEPVKTVALDGEK